VEGGNGYFYGVAAVICCFGTDFVVFVLLWNPLWC
jgi:hypothetical protein